MALSPATDPDLCALEMGGVDLTGAFTPVFHKFRSLPPELRARIWRLATPRASVVERAMDNKTLSYALHRHTTIPAVLQVCRESRAELLYEAGDRRGAQDDQFEMLYLTEEDKACGKGVFMNMKKDTLLLYRAPPRGIMPHAANFANVQNLAMEWGLRPCWIQDQCHVGFQLVQQFPSLRILTLLVSFRIMSDLPIGQSGNKHREQTQKRRALHEIKGWVAAGIEVHKTQNPEWNVPEVRVVPRTKYWTSPRTPQKRV